MTEQYSIVEVSHNLAALVRRLEKQSLLEITRRGKPVAVLMSLHEYQRPSAERVGFWRAYSDFLIDVKLAELNIEPEVFAGMPSREPGRRLDFSIRKNDERS